MVAIVVSAGVGLVVSNSVSSSPSATQVRLEALADFRHLLGSPESAAELAPYVQSANGVLATAIAAAAVQSPSEDSNLTPDGTASISAVKIVAPGVAAVDFGISDSGSDNYVQRFVGDVVATDGRWKLSWATVCMLVEAESYVCPNPPATLLGAVPLPHALQGDTIVAHHVPDLVRPQALAVLPNGDLLIVDSDRDQILRWQPDGTLSVFAGTGQPGSSGIGGPAVDARLPEYFGYQLAVAKDGTVYATGGNDCGLLVIEPSGTLERAETQLCDASGVAVAASGTLYLSASESVYRVSASGAVTEIARSADSPQKVPAGVPTATGFSPADLALQGDGDLDIYSNGPRAIWRLTSTGKLTNIGIEYSDGMASAPDGSVLVAGHGGSIDRVGATTITSVADLLSTKIAGYGVPDMRGGFQPNGIAVAPSGAIFVDTFSGNGWTDATSVAELPPHGRPFQLSITTPALETLPGTDAPGFPSSVFPASIHAQGSDLAACPSTAGLEPFNAAAIAQTRKIAAQYNAYSSSFWGDLHNSDRSWWSGVVYDWTSNYDNDTHTVGQDWPATSDTFAPVVSHACGEALVRDSEVVVETPSSYSWQVTHLFFVDRDGHPLVYFQAS
jgi:hypothetical protein